jgi:membrane-bound lytic murein transglycosylase F
LSRDAPFAISASKNLLRGLHSLVAITIAATLWAALSGVMLMTGGCERTDSLERVLRRGELVVATRNSATSHYIGPDGKSAGFEYELARRFADYLGVSLRIHEIASFDEVLPAVHRGNADLAAAGLAITPERARKVDFGPVYQETRLQVVYRAGSSRPREVADLVGKNIAVIAGSSYAETLAEYQSEFPALSWREVPEVGIEGLFEQVAEGEIDCTIADSNIVSIHRRYFPEVRPAFTLGEPQQLAWAFHPSDRELRDATREFMEEFRDSGRLAALRERHYAHVRDFDFVGVHTFLKHVDQRLPSVRSLFKKAEEKWGVDWRLLAAVGYQESHWNPNAVSPTGVRGLMMLTLQTAEQLDIDNRLDPRSSVFGGARYLKRIKSRLPERITDPDRTWMALAAYNIGMGHLEDARIITEIRGGNPDRWLDVKENLPLLSDREWHSRVQYGYARGREPVQYVSNIRSYYDILVWLVDRETPVLQASADEPGSPVPTEGQ